MASSYSAETSANAKADNPLIWESNVPDFSARHPKRPSKRASGLVAMKVRKTKEVFGQDFVCQSLQA
jgi:hypothetical protein